jgi:hypothetical protein
LDQPKCPLLYFFFNPPLQKVNFRLELGNPLELNFLITEEGVQRVAAFIEQVDEVVELLAPDVHPTFFGNRPYSLSPATS